MSEHIKNFIEQHRAEFDDKEPSDLVWLNIQKDLEKKNNSRNILPFVMKIAAVFVTILAVGIVIGLNLKSTSSQSLDYAMSPQMIEYKKSEDYYMQRVSHVQGELAKYGAEKEASYDIEELEAVFNELKAELLKTDYRNKETIMEAMIQNHKTKVEILERILEKTKSNTINDDALNI